MDAVALAQSFYPKILCVKQFFLTNRPISTFSLRPFLTPIGTSSGLFACLTLAIRSICAQASRHRRKFVKGVLATLKLFESFAV